METTVLFLLDPRGRRFWLPSGDGSLRVDGLGVVNPARFRGREGRKVTVGGKPFLVLSAATVDLLSDLERGAQTVGPKDVASLLLGTDIGPESRVIEGGSGSGSLTMALARSVGPAGHVYSYDVRPESLRTAQANVARAGLEDIVTFREADLRSTFADREVDAVILDIPDPWAAVPSAWDALRPCGHLATFSPNMEQVKETAAAIRARPFVGLRTVELIEREMEVREVGVRPSFAALGHTGYLTFARKVLDTF